MIRCKNGIVGFHFTFRYVWWIHHCESGDHSVGELFAAFFHYEVSEPWTRTSSKRMRDLKALKRFCILYLSPDCIKGFINNYLTFDEVSFCPIFSCWGLTGDYVIGSKQVSHLALSNSIDHSWLSVNKDRSWDEVIFRNFTKVDIKML